MIYYLPESTFWTKHVFPCQSDEVQPDIYMSHEQIPRGWLGYMGDEKLPIYRDYNKPLLRIPMNQPVYIVGSLIF